MVYIHNQKNESVGKRKKTQTLQILDSKSSNAITAHLSQYSIRTISDGRTLKLNLIENKFISCGSIYFIAILLHKETCELLLCILYQIKENRFLCCYVSFEYTLLYCQLVRKIYYILCLFRLHNQFSLNEIKI